MRHLAIAIALSLSPLPALADCRTEDSEVGTTASVVGEVLDLVVGRTDLQAIPITAQNRNAFERAAAALDVFRAGLERHVEALEAAQTPMMACLLGAVVEYDQDQLAIMSEARAAARALVPLAVTYIAAHEVLQATR